MRLGTLEKLVEIQSGYQSRGKIIESLNGSYHLLQAKDIVEGTPCWNSTITFTPELNPDRYKIGNNDILFIARGYENHAYLAIDPLDNVLASNTFYIIRPKEIQSGFLAWWLNQEPAQSYFAQFQVKMGYAYMSKKNLAKLEVPVPSLEIQAKISQTLKLWDHEQQLISKITALKKSVINSIFLSATQEKEG